MKAIRLLKQTNFLLAFNWYNFEKSIEIEFRCWLPDVYTDNLPLYLSDLMKNE